MIQRKTHSSRTSRAQLTRPSPYNTTRQVRLDRFWTEGCMESPTLVRITTCDESSFDISRLKTVAGAYFQAALQNCFEATQDHDLAGHSLKSVLTELFNTNLRKIRWRNLTGVTGNKLSLVDERRKGRAACTQLTATESKPGLEKRKKCISDNVIWIGDGCTSRGQENFLNYPSPSQPDSNDPPFQEAALV